MSNDTQLKLFGGIFGSLILFGFFCFIDGAIGEKTFHTGVVVDKHYEPSRTETYTVHHNNSTELRTRRIPEKYIVAFRTEWDGDVEESDVPKQYYYNVKIDQEIQYAVSYGRWTGWNYGASPVIE